MTYQAFLKDGFKRRVNMNPRFSLRAYAKQLGLSPSKLSEILTGKKGLSPERAEDVCDRLKLTSHDRELFSLSVRSQHARVRNERTEAKTKLKELLAARDLTGGKTKQKNAWYFGAVKAAKEAGFDPDRLTKSTGISSMQIENSERFIGRIGRLHPERHAISFDASSVVKKLNEDYATGALKHAEAEFAFLTEEQTRTLVDLLRTKIEEFSRSSRTQPRDNLTMFFIGASEICKKEDLC